MLPAAMLQLFAQQRLPVARYPLPVARYPLTVTARRGTKAVPQAMRRPSAYVLSGTNSASS